MGPEASFCDLELHSMKLNINDVVTMEYLTLYRTETAKLVFAFCAFIHMEQLDNQRNFKIKGLQTLV